MANFLRRAWSWASNWGTGRLLGGWGWVGDVGDVDAGVVVNREDAMEIAAYLATFTALTWDVSQVPLRTYRRLAGGDRQDVSDSPIARPWTHGPNAWQTMPAFLGQIMYCLQSTGDYFAQVGYVGGSFDELYPLEDPTEVEPRIEGARPVFRWRGRDWSGGPPRPEIFHLHLPSFQGFHGLDFLATERQTLGLARAIYRHGALFFANGAAPGGILVLPANVDPADAKTKFAAAFGAANAHKVFACNLGTTWTPVGVDAEKAQMLETRKQVNAEICALRRYPVWRLYGETPSTLEGRTGYWTETVAPWLELIASAVNKWLMPADHYVEFDLDVLLRADPATRWAAYGVGVSSMILSRNEPRRWEGLPSLGPDGDKIVNPNTVTDRQMLAAGDAGAGSGQ